MISGFWNQFWTICFSFSECKSDFDGQKVDFFTFGPENLGVPGFRELYLRAQEELGVVLGLYPCVRKQYFPFAPLRATRNRVRHL